MLTAVMVGAALLGVHESSLAPLHAGPSVRGYSRGVDAVGFDPAAVGMSDGLALQYRHRIVRDDGSIGRLGAFATLPIWRLVLSAGYEWNQIPRARFERGTLGLAAVLSKRLSLGLAMHALSSPHPELRGTVLSAGAYSEVTSWLSLSAGVDGFNRPALLRGEIRPDFVLGASVRPILGRPWLTLGSEVRVGAGGRRGYNIHLSRAVVDVSPYEGIHLLGSYARLVDDLPLGSRLPSLDAHQVWFGLSVAFGGLEASVATVGLASGTDRLAVDGGDVGSDTRLALTVRMRPTETVAELGGRRVDVALGGDLRQSDGPLDPGSPVPDVVWRLDRLAEDDTVATVVLNLGELDVGMATVEELRRAVQRLRASGKIVVANIANVHEKTYMVAAACNYVRMDPVSSLVIDGFSSPLRYYAEALAKIGVRVESVEVGQHKTAPDSLTRSEPRPEELQMREAVLEEAFAGLLRALREDRGMSQARVDEILSRGLLTSADALELGLVDELTSTVDPREVPPFYPAGQRLPEPQAPSRLWGQRPIIAVVPIVGTIALRSSDNILPGATAEAVTLVPELDALAADGDVAAVVLRIDSPGGDVLASDLIWRSVRRLAAIKPVVVSMGDTAASGGYWVAAPAHRIFASRNTITGSIGIFTMRVELSDLFARLGIHSAHPKRGEHAGWDSLDRPASDEDRERVRRNLQAHYETFVAKVAAGRGRDLAEIRAVADGRVMTGVAALEAGLVDEIGGLAEAIRDAAARAGLDEDDDVEVRMPRHRPTLGRLVRNLVGLAAAPERGVAGSLADLWHDLLARIDAWDGRAVALMPYSIEIDP